MKLILVPSRAPKLISSLENDGLKSSINTGERRTDHILKELQFLFELSVDSPENPLKRLVFILPNS